MRYRFATLLFIGCIAAWGVGRYFLRDIGDPSQLWDAQVKLVQAIVVVAALIVAWRQSQIAIEQLRLSREKRESEELQDARKQIRDLVEAKQIVITERNDTGDGYRIVNVGQSTAMNVWLIEEGKRPQALGSLTPRCGSFRTSSGTATSRRKHGLSGQEIGAGKTLLMSFHDFS